MSLLAQPGASSTVSPGRAIEAAAATACTMALVSVAAIIRTGTSGACRASEPAITSRSIPSSTAARSRAPCAVTRSSKVVPLAWPPAIQTTLPAGSSGAVEPNERSAASAACGLVALESSTQRTPSRSVTVWILCDPRVTLRRPSRTATGSTPNERARAAAASALATLCGASGTMSETLASSSAESRRCSMKARSTSRSSTTPSIEGAGVPRVNPIARAPSTTSASSTMRSVTGSWTL